MLRYSRQLWSISTNTQKLFHFIKWPVRKVVQCKPFMHFIWLVIAMTQGTRVCGTIQLTHELTTVSKSYLFDKKSQGRENLEDNITCGMARISNFKQYILLCLFTLFLTVYDATVTNTNLHIWISKQRQKRAKIIIKWQYDKQHLNAWKLCLPITWQVGLSY